MWHECLFFWELLSLPALDLHQEAVQRFFFGEQHAPRFLVAMLLASCALRLGGWGGLGALDLVVAAAVAVFWAFQEWWLHKYLLHAPFKVCVCVCVCVSVCVCLPA